MTEFDYILTALSAISALVSLINFLIQRRGTNAIHTLISDLVARVKEEVDNNERHNDNEPFDHTAVNIETGAQTTNPPTPASVENYAKPMQFKSYFVR